MSGPSRTSPAPAALDLSADEVLRALPDGCLVVDAQWRILVCNPAAEPLLGTSAAALVGRGLLDAFPEAAGTVFETQYRTAMSERRPVGFTAEYPPLGRWFAVQASPHRDGLLIHFHDVSEHVVARQRTARYAAAQATVREVATAVAGEAAPEVVWQLVAERSVALVDASASWVLRFEGDGYRVMAATGQRLDAGQRLAFVPGSDIERVARTGEPLSKPAGAGGRAAELGIAAVAIAPVRVGGRTWGAVSVGWEDPRPDIADDLPWLSDLGDLVALAGANATAREAIARRATTDALTGLANLQALHEQLDARISAARRHGGPLTLALVDVDHFKAVNDGYGHADGDRVLRAVADVLADACRHEDLAARIGGDEFALVLEGSGGEAALAAAERVRAAMRAVAPPGLPAVTLSIGLCEWSAPLDREDMQRRADDALYWAKLHGRDAVWVHDPDVMDVVKPQDRADALRRAGAVVDPAEVRSGLRTIREFWRSTLDALEEHVGVLDEHGRILAVNRAWRRFAERYAPGEALAVGDDYVATWEAAPVAGAAAIAAAVREVVRGEREEFEVEYQSAGNWFVMRMSRWAGDRPRRFVVHREDVTQRRLAQDALARQAELLSKVPAAVMALDLDGVVTQWNLAAEKLYGWSAEEAIGRSLGELVVPPRARPRVPALLATLARGEDVEGEADAATRDGKVFPVHAHLRPVLGEDGRPVGAIGVAVDVSAQHEIRRRETDRLVREADGLRWAARIRAALDEDRFVLHAQPIVDLATGAVAHHELLLRLQDPEGRLVPPAEFLPAAEEHGLMRDIDAWVVEQAVRLAAGALGVHVNLSAQSIGDPAVLGRLRWALETTGADPGRIAVEVTETALIGHAQEAARFARTLHGLGCRVALDDFGTGYNSFARLKQLPIDVLKIDRQFVRDILTDTASESVVRAIVSLADDLGVHTVAEGIEEAAVAERVRALGVTHGQGWHHGRPGPLAA